MPLTALGVHSEEGEGRRREGEREGRGEGKGEVRGGEQKGMSSGGCPVHVDSEVLIPFTQWGLMSSVHPLLCRTIYEQLARAVLEEHRVHYHQRVDEIAPSIRYCAYNIGDMPSDVKELTKLRVSMPGYELLASKIDVSSCHQWPCVCLN